MKAIRGATTVQSDTPQNIRAAVRELLDAMCRENGIEEHEILFTLFSNTADLRSLYPAKAAREAGYLSGALFSAAEPDIDGGLPLCIRVMMLAETESCKPVYLRGAASLRKDLQKIAIALDGPSGSGKSTIAKILAKRLNILYLDTGAMYRACALKVASSGTEQDEQSVAPLLDGLDLRVEYIGDTQHTFLDGRDVSEEIRRPEVSMAASAVSALPCVRKKLVQMQREIAERMSCVLDGRDIGTYVLPNADFKFFLTADAAVRARRRYEELKAKGFSVDLAQLQREIEERDRNDSTRAVSPLRRAEDAVLINTSELSIEAVVAAILQKIQEKV